MSSGSLALTATSTSTSSSSALVSPPLTSPLVPATSITSPPPPPQQQAGQQQQQPQQPPVPLGPPSQSVRRARPELELRPIHVWVGSNTQEFSYSKEDLAERARQVVQHFLQQRAEQQQQQQQQAQAPASASSSSSLTRCAMASPTATLLPLSSYSICVEREGDETEQFLDGFQDG